MKKIFVIAMLATVAMTACSKDDTTPAEGAKKYVQVTIPEEMVTGETRTTIDGTTTNWVAGDQGSGTSLQRCHDDDMPVYGRQNGPTTTFSGDVPIGSYSLAAAYYPYDCNATFDAVNKTFKHTWGSEYCTDNLGAYDFMYTNIWEEQFEVNETTSVLPVHFTFKPLMARIKISLGLGANETPKKIILETENNVMPTAGTIDALGNFTASSVTNSITVSTNQKEFDTGPAPRGHPFDDDREC